MYVYPQTHHRPVCLATDIQFRPACLPVCPATHTRHRHKLAMVGSQQMFLSLRSSKLKPCIKIFWSIVPVWPCHSKPTCVLSMSIRWTCKHAALGRKHDQPPLWWFKLVCNRVLYWPKESRNPRSTTRPKTSFLQSAGGAWAFPWAGGLLLTRAAPVSRLVLAAQIWLVGSGLWWSGCWLVFSPKAKPSLVIPLVSVSANSNPGQALSLRNPNDHNALFVSVSFLFVLFYLFICFVLFCSHFFLFPL